VGLRTSLHSVWNRKATVPTGQVLGPVCPLLGTESPRHQLDKRLSGSALCREENIVDLTGTCVTVMLVARCDAVCPCQCRQSVGQRTTGAGRLTLCPTRSPPHCGNLVVAFEEKVTPP
jgi:hypothetical protein